MGSLTACNDYKVDNEKLYEDYQKLLAVKIFYFGNKMTTRFTSTPPQKKNKYVFHDSTTYQLIINHQFC